MSDEATQSSEFAPMPDFYQDSDGGVWMNLRKHPEGWPGAYDFDSGCSPLYLTGTKSLTDLLRWKAEALPVLDGLQELGRALDLPLGIRITGPQALAAVERLNARLSAVKATLNECDALAESVHAKNPAMGSAYGRIVQFVRAAIARPEGDK